VERFETDIRNSGRRAILVFVPEHGAGLRASSIQEADLRELPLPYETIAPVGIKLLGWKLPGQVRIDKPASYLDLAFLLSGLLELPDGGAGAAALRNLAANIPEAGFVSENKNAVVISAAGGYFLKISGGKWTKIPDDTFPLGRRMP